MSSLEKKYQELIHCLEKNIKDAKELSIAKEKLADLVVNYSNLVSKSLEMDNKLERIELNMASMHERLNSIEDDLYLNMDEEDEDDDGIDEMHDNDFEFEIVCPYCQYEFITDSTYKNISQIRCPKCKKTIELDWQDEPLECGGHCHSCGGHCGEDEEDNEEISTTTIKEDDEKYTINVQEPEKQENKNEKKKKDDNEDDM